MIVKYPSVFQITGESVWVTYAKVMTRKRNGCLNCVVTGLPGTGKSYSAISYLYAIDPEHFNIDRIYFKGSDLLRDINSDRLPNGSCILFDESGCDLSSKNWQDAINKAFSLIFQTLRHRNYVIVLTLPYMNMLSKDVRTLLTAHFETLGWTEDKQCRLKPFGLEYNSREDKFYRKRLFTRLKSKRGFFCNETRFPLAPKELLTQYEAKKKAFLNNLYGNLQNKLAAYEKKQTEDTDNILNLKITDKQEQILDRLKQGMLIPAIARELNVSEHTIYIQMKALNTKGIQIKAEKEHKTIKRYAVIDPRSDVYE